MNARFSRCAGALVAIAALAVTAMPAAADAVWQGQLTRPQPRSSHAAVYDTQHDRMIVFGGRCADACCSNGPVPNDVWSLPLAATTLQWSQLRPAGLAPPAGLGPAAIYDPVRARMLVPDASTGTVWSLALSGAPAWSSFVPTGTAPPSASAAVYDPVRDRMLVVSSTGRVFALALATSPAWVELLPSGRLPTRIVGGVYDPVRDRVVLLADSVRALTLADPPAWSMIAAPRPQLLNAYSVVYDATRDRVVIHGGCRTGNCGTTETWALTLAGTPAWASVSTGGPLLSLQSAIYDAPRDRMVLFGGYDKQVYTDWTIGDLWVLSFAPSPSWRNATPPGPPAACGATAVRDAPRDRLLLFADSTYAFDLAGAPAWSTLVPAGTPPFARTDYSVAYDAARDRVLLFGGTQDGVPLSDLYALGFAPLTWTALAATGTPPTAAGPALLDAARDRMLVVGGAQVWALSLTGTPAWSLLSAAGTPPTVTSGFTAALDVGRDRVLVFGGRDAGGIVNTVWQLALSPAPAWSIVAAGGVPPAAREHHVAAIDAARDRMVIAAGDTAGALPAHDTWELPLAPGSAWHRFATSTDAFGASAIADPARDRMVTFTACDAGEAGCPAPLPRCSALSYGGALGVPVAVTAAGAVLAQSRPNPARGPLAIPFSLARPGPVTLRIDDLAGRRVTTLVDAPLPAGDHVARWDGMGADGRPAPPGAYFYELRTPGARLQRRLVLLR
jgi:hypothetical protein